MTVIYHQPTENYLMTTKEPKPISKRDAAANEMALRIIKILSNGAKKEPVAELKERTAA
jgi:hypothetical protein